MAQRPALPRPAAPATVVVALALFGLAVGIVLSDRPTATGLAGAVERLPQPTHVMQDWMTARSL